MRSDTFTDASGHRYDVRVHVPGGDEGRTWPVVWLLDAPSTWPPMRQALDAGTDAAVVVAVDWHGEGGVDRRLRFRDFTTLPQHPDGDPDAEDAGGADAFRAFLTGTLRPALQDTLPIDRTRQTLLGHSLSGLFVLDTLLRCPDAFDRYIALSPSLWWDGARAVAQARAADDLRGTRARVWLRAGLGEQTAGPEKPAAIDGEAEAVMLGDRHMVANAQAFADALRAHGVDCDHDALPDVGHHDMLAAAMPDALRFACAR